MNFDFSQITLQYLIQARDLAMQSHDLAAIIMGIPEDMARLLTELTPQELSYVAQIKQPLLIPRQEAWWWSRLFKAVRDGCPEEIEVIMEHIPLIPVP